MQFQINPPQGRSSEIPTCRGRGVLKAKIIEVNCLVLNWNFLVKGEGEWGGGGGGGGAKQKTFCGGSMDVFWNCTLYRVPLHEVYAPTLQIGLFVYGSKTSVEANK